MATSPCAFPYPPSPSYHYPPNPIQIHGGYYPPPPYLAGYGSAPPTFPEPPPPPPQPPPSFQYAASYSHPLPVYVHVPASPTPIHHHPPPPPALDPYPSRFELSSAPKPACSASTNPTPPAFSSTASSTSSVSPAPAYDAVQFSPPPPAGRLATANLRRQVPTTPSTTLPSIPTSKVTNGGAPADRTVMELHAYEVRSMAENSRARCKGGKSDEQSDIVFHRATPDFRCQGSTTEENGSATPRNACVSKTKKSDSDLLARRALLDISRRMDEHQAQSQLSLDFLQGELSKLVDRLSSLTNSMVSSSTSSTTTAPTPSSGSTTKVASAPSLSCVAASSGSSSFGASSSGPVASQVFGKMPTPKFRPRKFSSPLHYYREQETSIQNSCVQSGSTSLREQEILRMPQSYGFHNFDRQSIVLSDGTEHRYYALPDTRPLEQAAPETIFDVDDDKSNACSNEFIPVFTGISAQLTYEEEKSKSRQAPKCFNKPIFSPETPTVPTVGIFSLTNERSSDCPLLKTSSSYVPRFSQLSIMHSVRELRLMWDPGDTTLHILLTVDSGATKLHDLFMTATGATKLQGTNVYKFGLVHLLAVQFGARCEPNFESAIMHSYVFALGWTKVNASATVQDDFSGLKEIPVYVIYADVNACKSYLHPTVDIIEMHTEEAEVKVDSGKPIISPARPTVGIFSSTSELMPEASQHSVQVLQQANQQWNMLMIEAERKEWDPGILSLINMLLGKTAVPNLVHHDQIPCKLVNFIGQPVDLKQIWSQLLLQCHSLCTTLNAFLQVQYCCLPTVLDCLYSEPVKQLICHSSMFSSTAICMSIASTLFMILVLSFEEIAEGPDVAAAYQVNIKLPMRQTTHDWNPGINSLLLVYIWLLSSQKYLQIKEMDIIFITHLPP